MTLPLAILRTAALLTPAPERAEWLAEWEAELWHVKHRQTLFCLGAFLDAFWLRRNSSTPNAGHTFGLASPLRCVFFLTVLAAITVFFAFRLPAAREMLLASPYRDARNLAMISVNGRAGWKIPTVPMEQYRSLAHGMRGALAGVAYYRPIQMPVQTALREPAKLSIAVASANLFDLLEIPIPAPSQAATKLVLSHDAWRKYFAADPHIVGRVLEVAGQSAVIAAVLPVNLWRLPGRTDAWLLQDQSHLAELAPSAEGFVLAHLGLHASQLLPRWHFSMPDEREGFVLFDYSRLAQETAIFPFFLMMVVAFLILSTTTRLALGEYPANRYSPPGVMRLRRWIFFAIKIALLLVIVFCGSLDLGSISVTFVPNGLLIGPIFAMRWAWIDQQQRCPVCLRLLTKPILIGGAAQTFLEWYGTELMCAQGHGLLYVPEIPSSCYSTQRWQYLDPSWSSLFS